MSGLRPDQALLTKDNDLSKSNDTLATIEAMVDGKIVDNWVMVDFPSVMQQLGVDPFNGHGWERFDADVT